MPPFDSTSSAPDNSIDPATDGDAQSATVPGDGGGSDAATLSHALFDALNRPGQASGAPQKTAAETTPPATPANPDSTAGSGAPAGSPMIWDAGGSTLNQLFGYPSMGSNFNASRAQVLADLGATGLSYTGAGIMVGVISGSFGDLFQLAASQGNPNPASQNPALNEQAGTLAPTVLVIADAPLNAGAETTDDEGRAMLQVVHEIAPGAAEAFYSAAAGAGDLAAFAAGILELAAAGCRVICDDVAFSAFEPWFQGGTTSPPLTLVNGQLVNAQAAVIDQAIATVTAEGVVYVSCASNDGAVAYENPNSWTSTIAQGITLTTPAQFVQFANSLNFGTAQNPTAFINVTLTQALSNFNLALQWDEPWGNATSQLEIDLWVQNPANGVEELFGEFNQTQGQGAFSDGVFVNGVPVDPALVVPQAAFPGGQDSTVGPGTIQLSIRVLSGPIPAFIKLVTGGNSSLLGDIVLTSYQNGANLANTGTSVGHNDGLHVVTAGAVDAGNVPVNNSTVSAPVSEPFSASGQNSYYFLGPNGNAIAPFALPGIAVSGVDDIATSVAGSLSDFFGTSCATPAVAAVIALVMQADPHLNLLGITYVLEKTATPTIAVTGAANPTVGGAGLVNASAAIALALSVPPPSLGGAGTTATYLVGSGAVAIGAALTVSDPSTLAQNELANATVSITAGLLGGDTLSANTAGTSISESYNSSTGVLSLTGIDTLADYQAVLRSLTYSSTNPNPTASGADSARTIMLVAQDQGQISTAVTNSVTVINQVSGRTAVVNAGQTSGNLVLVSGGFLDILSGGTANFTVVSSTGADFVQSGGIVSSTLLSSGGDEFVEVGGSANGTLDNGGSQEIYGFATGTVIGGGGRVDLFTGGTTIGTVAASGVELVIGTASGTIDVPGGFDFVYGSAVGTKVNGGAEYIELGAVASGTKVTSAGAQVVYGSANGTVLDSGGTAYFLAGSEASGTVVNNGLAVILQVASATTVAGGGFDFVEPGGTALGTVLNGGDEFIEPGGTALGTIVGNGATQVDYGVTNGTVLNSGGFEYVYPGGTALGTVVDNGGVDNIFVGFAVGTVDNSGGKDFIYSGLASGTIVAGGGAEFVEFGGTAIGTLVSGAGATQDVVAGRALGTTLSAGGLQVVEGGETASNTTIDTGGYEFVEIGGTADGATISGGTVELTAGAATLGPIAFAAGAGGLFQLDDAQHFAGTVAGFGLPDRIDLEDIGFASGRTTLTFTEAGNNLSGTLSVNDGTHAANLTLLGQYVAGQFHIASDGAAGTLVTDPPPPTAVAPAASELANPH